MLSGIAVSLKTTTRNFAHLLSANVAGRVVSLFTLPVILRLFAPAEYAKLSLFVTVLLIAGMLVNWPGSAMGRFGREEFLATGACRRTFWSVTFLRLPLIGVIVAGVCLLGGRIEEFTQLPPAVNGLIVASLVLSFAVGLNEILQAEERFGLSSWVAQLPTLFNVAVIVAVRSGLLSPTGIVLAGFSFAASVIVSLSYLLVLGRKIGRPIFDRVWIRNILLFSWPFFFHYIGVYSLDYVDIVVLRHYIPLTIVGVYTVAYTLNVQLRAPILSLSPLIFPKLTSLHLAGHSDKVNWFYERIVPQINLFISIGLAFGMLLLPLVGWFVGARFSGAVAPLCLMLGGMAFHTITVFITPMTYVSRRTGIHVIAYLSMAVVNLVVDLMLVPRWGVMGAAAAKCCADITGLLIHAWWFKASYGIETIRFAGWGWPCWLVMLTVLIGAHWLVSLAACIAAVGLALLIARHAQRFDEESAGFYEKLGLPEWLSLRVVGAYRRWLIPARV